MTKKHPKPLVLTGALHAIQWIWGPQNHPPKSLLWMRQLKKCASDDVIYEQPLTCDVNGNISFSIDIFFIRFAKSHSPWLKPLGSWLGLECRFQKRVSQQKVDILIFKPTLKFFYLPLVHSAFAAVGSRKWAIREAIPPFNRDPTDQR